MSYRTTRAFERTPAIEPPSLTLAIFAWTDHIKLMEIFRNLYGWRCDSPHTWDSERYRK